MVNGLANLANLAKSGRICHAIWPYSIRVRGQTWQNGRFSREILHKCWVDESERCCVYNKKKYYLFFIIYLQTLMAYGKMAWQNPAKFRQVATLDFEGLKLVFLYGH